MRGGEVDSLLGTSTEIPTYKDLVKEEADIKLPKVFMLGRTFRGTLIRTSDNAFGVAYIPIGGKPLAL